MNKYSVDYGDNVKCGICSDVFDARNTRNEIRGELWVCEKCAEELED